MNSPWSNSYTEPGYKETQPVGQLNSNPLGLFDISGNVEEYCFDWSTIHPSERVKRGGSYRYGYIDGYVGVPNKGEPDYKNVHFGLRLAR